VTARSLPSRPNLDQLKRQARDLLRRQPQLGRLRDAQRIIAEEYGYGSWDGLRTRVESLVGTIPGSISDRRNLTQYREASFGTHSTHQTRAMSS